MCRATTSAYPYFDNPSSVSSKLVSRKRCNDGRHVEELFVLTKLHYLYQTNVSKSE